MGTRRVTPNLIKSGAATIKAAKPASKIATLVEVLREARRKETELQRLSKCNAVYSSCFQHQIIYIKTLLTDNYYQSMVQFYLKLVFITRAILLKTGLYYTCYFT